MCMIGAAISLLQRCQNCFCEISGTSFRDILDDTAGTKRQYKCNVYQTLSRNALSRWLGHIFCFPWHLCTAKKCMEQTETNCLCRAQLQRSFQLQRGFGRLDCILSIHCHIPFPLTTPTSQLPPQWYTLFLDNKVYKAVNVGQWLRVKAAKMEQGFEACTCF